MDEKDIKRLKDYSSSQKGRVIIQYFLKGDDKPRYGFPVEIGKGRIIMRQLGDYGRAIVPFEIIAEEGFEIANLKGIEEILTKKSKK